LNKVFIFSCEGWAGDFQQLLIAQCNCKNRNYQITVQQNVRPQLDMLIPTYLQWTFWTANPTLEESFYNLTEFSDWNKQNINAYKLGADRVNVRYSKDIVSDFCSDFGISRNSIFYPLSRKLNKSISIEAFTLLARNRELRSGPHDAYMDFLIEDYIKNKKILDVGCGSGGFTEFYLKYCKLVDLYEPSLNLYNILKYKFKKKIKNIYKNKKYFKQKKYDVILYFDVNCCTFR
jgi:2-polyprenyl-3-methyl-5-hydroxy-6-metoxy-1,4-benzoquinol methylase